MNLIKAKRQFIREHSLGNLTISELREKAKSEDIPIYGDKAQILQCFSQSELSRKLFELNR